MRDHYAEFRLRFEDGPRRRTYRVVASGPGGEVEGRFRLPFSDLGLENFVLKVGSPRAVRRLDSPEMELAKTFGGRLFDALLSDDVRGLYRASIGEATIAGQGLRIMLDLTRAPELQRVPWEYLYDRPRFLATVRRTPIVRYLDLPGPISPLRVRLPLRILGLIAATADLPNLDVERERQRLEVALKEPVERGQVELHWLPTGTWRDLQAALLQGPWHIFHFIGHGGFDELRGEGFVYIPDESGRATRLSSTSLGRLLGDHAPMRLAFLNSCEGGDAIDVFSRTAATVVQRGTPGVVAMQFEITDRAAILFSGEFYAALAQGRAVDEALSQARMAIFADDNDIEWGAPVLFMRVSDGRLFDIEAPVAMAGVEPAAKAEAERRRLEPEAAIASAAAAEQQRLEAEAAVAAERMRLEEETAAAAAAEQRRLQQETVAEAERQPLEQRAAAAQPAAELTDAQREQFADEERKWRDAEAAVLAQQVKARRGGVLGPLFGRRRGRRTEAPRSLSGSTEGSEILCGRCGQPNASGRQFCRRCGHALNPLTVAPPPPPSSGGLLGRLFRGRGGSRDAGPSTGSDSTASPATRIERTTSATFPAEVEVGATAKLVFSIGKVLPGGVQGFVSVEAPIDATAVELFATVHAPAFEVLSPSPPHGGGAPVVALPLNVVDPSWAVRGEFLLRAKPVTEPTDLTILLDFWHLASPVGQIRIETRVLPKGIPVLGLGKRPAAGDFRVSSSAPPPADITLFITDEGGGRYQVQATTPRVFMRELGEFPAGQNAWSYSAKILERFRDAGDLPAAARIDRLVGLGLDLWDNLPDAFHHFYWDELEGRDRSIAIYSQEPYIPWELIRPPTREGRTPGFLGSDFRVARWRNGRLFPDPLAVRDFVVIAPDYADQPLPGTAIEAADLASRFGARVVDGQYDPVAASLRSPEIQLVHFAGHGSYDEDAPLQSQIRLSDHDLLPTDVRTFRQGLGSGPFVFLNACEVGEQGWAFTGIGGWADVFCDVGCAGFIGPYWEVDDEVARHAALRFYDGLAAGKPVGEAIRDVRRAFDEPGPFVHHPTWLAYSLHCQPNIRIDLRH